MDERSIGLRPGDRFHAVHGIQDRRADPDASLGVGRSAHGEIDAGVGEGVGDGQNGFVGLAGDGHRRAIEREHKVLFLAGTEREGRRQSRVGELQAGIPRAADTHRDRRLGRGIRKDRRG